MEFLLIVHLNRTHTMEYSKILKRLRVSCSVVETPKSLGLSCGISVRCAVRDLKVVKQALSMTRFSSFNRIYIGSKVGMKVNYRPI